MFLNRYDPVDPGRNKIINNGRYQKQVPRSLNFNNNPLKPSKSYKDEIELSQENKNRADNLTKVTLKKFKSEKNERNRNTGLDYFI